MDDLERLRADCNLAAKFWGRTFGALGAVVSREKGEDAIKRLWGLMLSQHQQGFYHQGLRKLGISENEPPAVAAAKYHWFTNLIGGLSMEYVVETPKKVWIRYTAPMWTYPGTTMLAMPSSLRRTIFSIWHPANGKMMGNRRLGWVGTKFVMEGAPYDEGYFYEADHDLAPGEELRFEQVAATPEFDPDKAPRLDDEMWPEARKLKARRNWSREYVKTMLDCLHQMYGPYVAAFLWQQTMRGMAVQYTPELKADCGIEGKCAKSLALFFARMLESQAQDFELTHDDDGVHRILLKSFLPFATDSSEALREASFQFQSAAAWMLNGCIRVTREARSKDLHPTEEIWEISDAGRWLY